MVELNIKDNWSSNYLIIGYYNILSNELININGINPDIKNVFKIKLLVKSFSIEFEARVSEGKYVFSIFIYRC